MLEALICRIAFVESYPKDDLVMECDVLKASSIMHPAFCISDQSYPDGIVEAVCGMVNARSSHVKIAFQGPNSYDEPDM